MKPSEKKYIQENAGRKSVKDMARELGLKERKVLKYMRIKGLKGGRFREETAVEEHPQQVSTAKKRTHLIYILIIFALVLAAYSNAIHNDFLWDDEFLIRDNVYIKSFSHLGDIFKTYLAASSGNRNSFYRPIQELTYMVDFHLWGYKSPGFHLTNIILHALCAICVYLLSLRIFKNAAAAFVTGVLFGVHPINTEAVTYVAGRADPLFLLFLLKSFVLFLKSTDSLMETRGVKLPYYILSVFCYIISILSKELGLIMPAFLLAYIWTFYSRSSIRNRLYYLCVPYAVVAALYAIARKTVLDFSAVAPSFTMAKFNIFIRFLTTIKSICVYLGLLIAPFGLHMERGIDVAGSIIEPGVLGAIFVIAVISYLIWRCRRTSNILSFAGLWFFIGLLPVSNIVPINSFIAEHWVYLSSIGAFLVIGRGMARYFFQGTIELSNRTRAAYGWSIVVVLTAFYGIMTFERNKDWKDPVSFFNNTIKYSPANSRLHLNFGNTYIVQGKYDEALSEYMKAIEFQPNYAESYSNIGNIYLKKGQNQKAKEFIDKALSIKPDIPNAQVMRGILYEMDQDTNKAEECYLRAIAILPDFVNAYMRLGQLYLNNGKTDKAISCWKKVLEISPDNPEAGMLIARHSH